MRVFLDTNVLVSAFATRGLCADLFRAVIAEHELILGECVLRELERALRDKLELPQRTVRSILAFLRRFPVEPAPTELPNIDIRDPDDLIVLACAVSAKADVLVTGDRDLLAIAEPLDLRIADPRGFWGLLKQAQTKEPRD